MHMKLGNVKGLLKKMNINTDDLKESFEMWIVKTFGFQKRRALVRDKDGDYTDYTVRALFMGFVAGAALKGEINHAK